MKELPPHIAESWIGKFVEYARPLPTPDIFKRWSAVACVIGALERRVWVKSAASTLYASHYILLVAPPGVGKSMVIKEVQKFWIATGVLKIAPDAATKAAMVDALAAAQRNYDWKGERIFFHSIQIASTEFGTLVSQYDNQTMNFYNRIWDCEDTHREQLRYGEHKDINIDYPQINMLAGTQPAYLGNLLPADAFGMGFTARLVLVYSGTPVRPTLFGARAEINKDLRADLIKGIKEITKLVGEMTFSQEAMDFLEGWYARNDDAPQHPRLEAYNVRRAMTLQKVCMAVCASRLNGMVIELRDVEWALHLMHEAEHWMPEIFKGMAVPDSSAVMAELYNFTISRFNKMDKKPVPEHMLIDFLKNRVEVTKIDYIMKHMIGAGMLAEAPNVQEPGKFEVLTKRYIPISRQA